MPEHPFRAIFGPDLAAVRAKDIAAKIKATDPTPDADDSDEGVQGTAVEMSTMQYAEALVSFKPLLDYAHELDQARARKARGPGRPVECTAFPVLVVWALKPQYPSERATIKELRDPANWQRLIDGAAAAWPDHPALPLPEKAPSRSQYRRFARRHLADNAKVLESLCSHVRRTAAKAARHMGMLDPDDGSLTAPKKRRTAFADETFLRSRLSRSPQECVDDNGELIHLFDPDAHTHFTNNKQDAGTRGYKVYMIGMTNSWCNQRIILDMGTRGTDITEGDNLSERIGLLQSESPEIRDGMQAVVYDRMLKAVHVDATYDRGVIPIVGTSLTNKGQAPTVVLRGQRFECRDGAIRHSDVRLLHTTACLDFVDGKGYPSHQPLRRLSTFNRPNSDGTYRWYNRYEVPDNPLLGKLSGATTTVRLNSTAAERQPGPPKRRTNALRAINPTDKCHRSLAGDRENAESIFSEVKTPLRHRRARSITDPRVQLDLTAHTAYTTVKALIHHHYENGTGADRWFGQREPIEPRPAESRTAQRCNSPP